MATSSKVLREEQKKNRCFANKTMYRRIDASTELSKDDCELKLYTILQKMLSEESKNGFKYHPTLSKVVYPGLHQSSPTTTAKPSVARVDVLLQPVPASVQ